MQGSMSSALSLGPIGTGLKAFKIAKSSWPPSGKEIFSKGTVENGANSLSHSKEGNKALPDAKCPVRYFQLITFERLLFEKNVKYSPQKTKSMHNLKDIVTFLINDLRSKLFYINQKKHLYGPFQAIIWSFDLSLFEGFLPVIFCQKKALFFQVKNSNYFCINSIVV